MMLGTDRAGGSVYGDTLKAYPAPEPSVASSIDDHDLKTLYTDHPFNWALNLALFHLGDAGVLADVHRY